MCICFSSSGPTGKSLDYVTLNPRAAEKFWIPDIFIDQAKGGFVLRFGEN